jgi:hypothetical protein
VAYRAVFQRKNDFNRESVRQDLIDIESKEAAIEYFNLDATKKHYWFGSLGARRVNQLIEKRIGKHSKPKCSGNMAMWEVIF